MEPLSSWQGQTDSFLIQNGIRACGNDYVGSVKFGIRNLFAPPNPTNSEPRPVFVAINGLSNSPSHRQWEVLVNDFSNGGGAADFSAAINRWRSVIDSVQAPAPVLTNGPTDLASGSFSFSFPGQRGRTNIVEYSTDLVAWTGVSNYFGTNAPVVFRETNLFQSERRLYRVRRP